MMIHSVLSVDFCQRSRMKFYPRQFLLLASSLTASFVLATFLFYFNHDWTRYHHHTIPRCSPAIKLVFMKTHKCASSTIENIVFRHAYRKDLNVALPLKLNYLSRQELFNRTSVASTPWGQLEMDVFTLHNRWNYKEVIGLMGQSAKMFSVVRQPLDLFESLYTYTGLQSTYGVNMTDLARLLIAGKANKTVLQMRRAELFGRNQMAWDFGIDPVYYDDYNSDIVRFLIAKLDQQFELVMIAERMDESLILLADLLCWPIGWIAHLDLNIRKPDRKTSLDELLSKEEREALTEFLGLDVAIYQHFYKRFEERLTRYNSANSRRMEQQLQLLHQANDAVSKRCVLNYVGNEKLEGKFKETNNNIMGYVVNQTLPDCELYAWSEPAFLEYFRTQMTRRVIQNLTLNGQF